EVIKALEKKGLITIEYIYEEGKKNIESRVMRVDHERYGSIRKVEHTGIRKVDQPTRESEQGYSGKLEDSNTSLNNTLSNTSKDIVAGSDSGSDSDLAKEVIAYLNEVTGKAFKA